MIHSMFMCCSTQLNFKISMHGLAKLLQIRLVVFPVPCIAWASCCNCQQCIVSKSCEEA